LARLMKDWRSDRFELAELGSCGLDLLGAARAMQAVPRPDRKAADHGECAAREAIVDLIEFEPGRLRETAKCYSGRQLSPEFGFDATLVDRLGSMKFANGMSGSSFSRVATGYASTVGIVAIFVGCAVLCGWALGISALTNFAPGVPLWPPMAPTTALVVALCGSALWLNAGNRHLQVATYCAGLAALLCLIRLVAYSFDSSFSLDSFAFRGLAAAHRMQLIGMTPATAAGYTLLGSAIVLAIQGRWSRSHQVCALLALLVGWLGFTHFVYGGAPLVPFSQMALHTELMLMALAFGALVVRQDLGLAALWVSVGIGGKTLRRLLPAALIVPLVAGTLAQYAQRQGWFGAEAGLSLLTLSTVVVFGGLVWANAAQLERADTERLRSEQRLRGQLERLNLLDRTTRAIGERQDLGSIFQVVIRSLEEHLPIDFGCFGLYEPAQRALNITSVGMKNSALASQLALSGHLQIDIGQDALGRCLRGELVYESDIARSSSTFASRLLIGGMRAMVISPLRVEEAIFGVLVCARHEPDGFSSVDCEFLRQLSEHLALATHQTQLYSALQQAYQDLRQTQQAVIQQERLRVLGQMASGIAHDINNALSPAALYAQSLLERNQSLDQKAREQLTVIQRAIDDVGNTVSRMREFYRPREDAPILAPLNLNELLQQVADLTRVRWYDMPQQRGVVIQLHTELANDLPTVVGVENEIRDALTNIILNAVDAMPGGGTLTLRSKLIPDSLSAPEERLTGLACVEIEDTGMGMTEEIRSRCIEPFFTTKGERGTGLGLAMVYGMLERHRGVLEIESELGRGTTLRLVFPKTTAPASPQRPLHERPLGALRLLVVDDDPLLLKSLRDTLESDGHTVHTADGGQAGIDEFHSARKQGMSFDAVITDLGMPEINGHAVAAAIKSASPRLPVAMLTGWGHGLQTEKLPEHVDRVLSKPPRLVELRAALAELTKSARGG
jgi:signal transduction histidine kinase/ActR/RegA family two-component response regulator